jgi:hypothetical protein
VTRNSESQIGGLTSCSYLAIDFLQIAALNLTMEK